MDGYIVSPFNSIIRKVTYPILSKIKNEESRLKDAYRQIVSVVMFAFLPLMFFTIATSNNMIITFFGSQWKEAGIYLKIAAFGVLLFPLQEICANVILLKGKTKAMLNATLIKQVIRIVLIFSFINKGVVTLAIVFAISNFIGCVLYIYLGMHYLKYNFYELIIDLYKTILASLLCIGVVVVTGNVISDINTILVFLIQALVMLVSYFIISKILRNNNFAELTSIIKTIFLQ
jgi:O-antigen/teichoic acid export membrane protein